MSSIDQSNNNVPIRSDYALYINGVYVPAAGIGISQTMSEITTNIYLAPAKEIRFLGYNDRLHFAFFIKDPSTGEFVLFTEGEIIGYSEQISSSSAFITLTGRSFKMALNFPVTSIVGDPNSLKSALNTTAAQIIYPPSMALLMGISGVYSNNANNGSNLDPKTFLTTITTPFDYVQSMFGLISGCGAILNNRTNNNESADATKAMMGSYIYRFANRYLLGKNIIKKIIPDVALSAKIFYDANNPNSAAQDIEQGKNYAMYYESYVRAVQVMSAISQKASPQTSGGIVNVIDNIVSLFEVASVPMVLPPLVSLKRHNGQGYTNPGRLIYHEKGKKYIGDIIYKTLNIFTVIPRSNYITSSVIENMNFNSSYVGRVTRVYSYFSTGDASAGHELLSLTASYPKSIVDEVLRGQANAMQNPALDASNLDLSLLISREEAFRGVNRTIIPPHPMHMYAITVANTKGNEEGANNMKNLSDEYLKSKDKTKTGEMILLNRYVLYNYMFMRSSESSCGISMPFNPYLIVGYPVLFADKKTGNNFVGIISAISHNISAGSSSTSISISNIMFLEEYVSKIAEAVEEEHPDFRAPSPFYIPNVDWLTQTYKGGSVYFGQLFYRQADPGCIIKLEDIFEFSDGTELSFEVDSATQKTKFTNKVFKNVEAEKIKTVKGVADILRTEANNSGPLKYTEGVKDIMKSQAEVMESRANKTITSPEVPVVLADIVVKNSAPGFTSYTDYLSFVFRPGVTLDEYIQIHREAGIGVDDTGETEDGKPFVILSLNCDPGDNVNNTDYSLTYSDVTNLLISYTNKILSQTPENFYGER